MKKLKKKSLHKVLPLLLCTSIGVGIFPTAHAMLAPLYQINVLVFERSAIDSLTPQTHVDLGAFDKAQTLTPFTGKLTNTYATLPNYKFELREAFNRISAQEDLSPILSIAWMQKFDGSEPNKTIHIQGGTPYSIEGSPIDVTDPNNTRIAKRYQVEGTINITLNRYFIVRADITDSVPDNSNSGSQNTPLKTFDIQQTYHTRSNEMHYLDNPAFGVLIKITPEFPKNA